MTDPRFPIADLIPLGRSIEDMAEDLDMTTRTIQRWLVNGVTADQADEFCAKILNVHPLVIFGTPWADASRYKYLAQIEDLPDDTDVVKPHRTLEGQESLL